MMRDLHDLIELRRAISPTRCVDNTPQVSQIIDRVGTEILEFAIAIGTIVDADATFQVLVEHGDASNLSDAAAVDDVQLLGVEGNAATPTGASFRFDTDDGTRKIGYVGGKRYVRLTITPALNTGNADISCLAILSGHRKGFQTSQAG